MTIYTNDISNMNEIAFARFEERRRVASFVKSIIVKFPEQFSSRRKQKIANDVCNILYKELEDIFRL